MISLRDILNLGKNLLEDLIDVFNLDGGEISDNFRFSGDNAQSDQSCRRDFSQDFTKQLCQQLEIQEYANKCHEDWN